MKSCPQCDSSEFDRAGVCMVCGYRALAEPSEPLSPTRGGDVTLQGIIEMESPKPADAGDEIPEQPPWRRELSRRLHAIKQKRDSDSTSQETASLPFPPRTDAAPPSAANAKAGNRLRTPRKTQPRPAVPSVIIPPRPEERSEITPQPPPASPEPTPVSHPAEIARQETTPPEMDARQTGSVRELIDSMVSKLPSEENREQDTMSTLRAPEPQEEAPAEKLILLSRTFAGLVDLLVVIVSASAVIFAVDVLEGIEIFDTVSFLHCLALATATNLVYSVFFLATGNQTIGMMITDLKLYGIRTARPGLGQVFARSAAYLFAAACGGLGLVWGFFDRRAMCLHDHLSGTRVERLPEV